MQSLTWYMNRLRSMEPSEIISRFKELGSNYISAIKIRSGSIEPPRIAEGTTLQGLSCPSHGLDRSGYPSAYLAALTAQAQQIAAGQLNFFQHEAIHLGEPINWHRDWNQGLDAPLKLCAFLDYRDAPRSGDCKQVWEPNRHHQFLVLARAYFITGEVSYAQACERQMLAWIEANPFGYGMNWRSPLELGIRIINWAWALMLLRDGGYEIETQSLRKIIHTLELLFTETHSKLSSGSSANNHLIGELAGVYVGAAFLAHLPTANTIRAEVKTRLEREMLAQTFEDGCGAEHAFGYQFFVAQFHIACLHFAARTDDSFSPAYAQRLIKMAQFIDTVSASTGTCPMLGDHDDGYVIDLGEHGNSVPGLMQMVAAVVPQQATALDVSQTSESAYWLGRLPVSQTAEHRQAPALESVSLPASGYHLLQSGVRGGSDSASVLMDVAELGFGAIAAHGHADALSIVVAIGGLAIFVDPDTYDYFTYPQWRRHFRTTAAHNTVCVDATDQSEILGPFLWGRRANARLLDFSRSASGDRVIGEHDGYLRLGDPLLHRRSVRLEPQHRRMTITDELECKDAHAVATHFHCHPECNVTLNANTVAIQRAHVQAALKLPTAKARLARGEEESRLGWYSAGYHRKQPSTTICVEAAISGSTKFEYTLTW